MTEIPPYAKWEATQDGGHDGVGFLGCLGAIFIVLFKILVILFVIVSLLWLFVILLMFFWLYSRDVIFPILKPYIVLAKRVLSDNHLLTIQSVSIFAWGATIGLLVLFMTLVRKDYIYGFGELIVRSHPDELVLPFIFGTAILLIGLIVLVRLILSAKDKPSTLKQVLLETWQSARPLRTFTRTPMEDKEVDKWEEGYHSDTGYNILQNSEETGDSANKTHQ